MALLKEVFGIAAGIPKYTYVDRSGLDATFRYYLSADRHVVVHGASKQGKTVLRRKYLPEDDSVVVQCDSRSTWERVHLEILRKLGSTVPEAIKSTLLITGEVTSEAKAEAKLPLLGGGEAGGSAGAGIEKGTEKEMTFAGVDSRILGFLADEIKKSKKRVVIEDFHYLPEPEKRRLAFDLKALWDQTVFLIIIGIWAEQNMLTYYNSDLSGRCEEVDIKWNDAELRAVLRHGEKILNIEFSPEIVAEILADAKQSVGLLQRIAEKVCLDLGVIESQLPEKKITDRAALDRVRTRICDEEAVRYQQFCEAVSRGYKDLGEDSLRVYEHIVRVCLEASDAELLRGLPRDQILERIVARDARIRQSDLTAALNKVNNLQSDRKISPLVVSYNSTSRMLQLVDRELLFFRKYGKPVWPWDERARGSGSTPDGETDAAEAK